MNNTLEDLVISLIAGTLFAIALLAIILGDGNKGLLDLI